MPFIDIELKFPIVGSKFTELGEYYATLLKPNEPLELIPEPDNAYDKNALAVYYGNIHLGYVPNIGITCTKCWTSVNKYQYYMCTECGTNKYLVEGGLATRIINQLLNNQEINLAVVVYDVRENSKTPVMVKLVTARKIASI